MRLVCAQLRKEWQPPDTRRYPRASLSAGEEAAVSKACTGNKSEKRDAVPSVPQFRSSTTAAAVVMVVMAFAAAGVAAPVSTAAAENQDEDDEPQAGAVIVSVVEPHVSHLAFSPFYASGTRMEPDRLKKLNESE